MKHNIDVKFWVYVAALYLITALVMVTHKYAPNVFDLVVWFGFFYFCIDPLSTWISRKVAKDPQPMDVTDSK